MIPVRFNLKGSKLSDETLIYLVYIIPGKGQRKRFKYSTGKKIKPSDWNGAKDKQRARARADKSHLHRINAYLDMIADTLDEIVANLEQKKKVITPDMLRFEMDKALNKGPQDIQHENLLSFIKYHLDNNPPVLIKSKKIQKRLEPGSLRSKKQVLARLKEFQKKYHRKIDFESVDIDFYNAFTNYLTEGKKLSRNTVGRLVKDLKSYLRRADEMGIEVNQDFKKAAFLVEKEEVDNIYLNENELEKIYTCDLSERPGLARVRDLFIVGAYTGLRFSDFSQIKPVHIKSDFIQIHTQKTGQKVTVPIHPKVREILTKYDGKLPKAISNQKMNDALKNIGELAKLNEQVETKKTKAGKLVSTISNKYDLISTHTARRSFATNAYKSGIPSLHIMKITGHKTERAFMRYIVLDDFEAAEIMNKYEFFNKSKILKKVEDEKPKEQSGT